MRPHGRVALLVIVLSLVGATPLLAGDIVFFDPMDGTFALQAADRGLFEPPVPINHNGTLIGGHNHEVIEAFDRVPGTNSFPLTFVDLAANTFLRATYQKADGTTGALGTSVVGSPSYRTAAGLQFIPTVSQADVTTGVPDRYRNEITAHFGADANVLTTRSFPDDPVLGTTEVGLSVQFDVLQDIPLTTGTFVDSDRFRVATLSSMFSSETVFDANAIRYEDSDGVIRTIALNNSTPRDTHLLASADEMGSWLELVKGPGSTWFPDSPTVRLDVLNNDGLTLGLQGFLANTLDPNDDSLSVWLEVLGSPDTLAAGTAFDVDFLVTARVVPEPSSRTLAMLSAIGLCGIAWRRTSKRFSR